MPNKNLIIGLGSPHGDDRVGWEVIHALGHVGAQSPSVIISVVSQPWDLLDHFQSQDLAILVDACVTGQPPGTIIEVDVDDLKQYPRSRSSSHGSTVPAAIEMAVALGTCPKRLVILGIEVAAWKPDSPLTPAVEHAIPRAAERIVHLLAPLFQDERS